MNRRLRRPRYYSGQCITSQVPQQETLHTELPKWVMADNRRFVTVGRCEFGLQFDRARRTLEMVRMELSKPVPWSGHRVIAEQFGQNRCVLI